MELVNVKVEDLESILRLYDEIIDHTDKIEIYAKWRKGVHPAAEDIRRYLEEGAMYLLREGKEIAGAMAVTMYQEEAYHLIRWGIAAADQEVAVIHILGVNPRWQGRGIGGLLVDRAVELANAHGKKALRLDALAANLPAQHMYLGKGFVYRGQRKLDAGKSGWIDFYFYEYIL